MILKKSIATLTAVALLSQPLLGQAADLNSAMSNLLGPHAAAQFNAPGRFESGARNTFSGGGLELRVPRQSSMPQLFSVSTPSIEAGCNGISAHFGGFSFISGAEIEQMLKQIASGAALGFVSQLVLKTLCPPCEDVVDSLKAAAQKAAEWSKNSCEIGKEAGQRFREGLGMKDTANLCSVFSANSGTVSDPLKAQTGPNGVCQSLSQAAVKIRELAGVSQSTATSSDEDKRKDLQLQCQMGTGNQTWQRLSVFDSKQSFTGPDDEDYRRRLIWLNIMGAQLHLDKEGEVSCESNAGPNAPTEAEPTRYCPPTLDPQRLVNYFMCGTAQSFYSNSAGLPQSIISYCQAGLNAVNNAASAAGPAAPDRVYVCEGNLETCNKVVLAPADRVFAGEGFLLRVQKMLRNAVWRVQNNRSFTETVTDGYGNTIDGRDILALIQAAPYPLYQAINAAAVYPAGATDLIDTLSVLVAEQLAYSMLDETIRLQGRPTGNLCLSDLQAVEMARFIDNLRGSVIERRRVMLDNLAVQESLTHSIRMLNQSIQRQVMSAEMLGNTRTAEAFNNAVSRSVTANAGVTP